MGRRSRFLFAITRRIFAHFFDTTWNFLDFSDEIGAVRPWIPKPANLDEMLALAAKLSIGFGYVRLDFYNVKGRVYFGEFTFTPAAGIIKYDPEFWDLKLRGEMGSVARPMRAASVRW